MTGTISTRFPQLPPETLQAKAAHLTIAACLLLGSVVAIDASWSKVHCAAGEYTSAGPCGIGVVAAGGVLFVALLTLAVGVIVLVRALRRPVDPDGGGGWRLGPGILVIVCGIVLALMIPRYRCPPGLTLSPLFRYCISVDETFPAPSPGLPWKFGAFAVALALGLLLLRWRSAPWWLTTLVAIVVFGGTVGFALQRAVGLPS